MPALSDNAVHRNTPTVTVVDNRGLVVRTIHYHRHPDTPTLTQARITRQQHDAKGFMTHSSDPRLHASGRGNFAWLTDLAGTPVCTHSADAGVSINLDDAAGRPLLAVSRIALDEHGEYVRSEAVTRTWHYENANLPGRPLGISEQVNGHAACRLERLVYAGNSATEKVHNLAGQASRHYHTAGLLQTHGVGLTGVPLETTQRLLADADNPQVGADWQSEQPADWEAQLQPESEASTTLTTVDATGAPLTTRDAAGHLRRQAYDVAGLLTQRWLTLKGGPEQVILKALSYSAAGQKLREEHGNGLITRYRYEPRTQRLAEVRTERPTGHTQGAKVLQDLRYAYDPVGNVLSVRNDAEETRFWRNQKVEPLSTYVYDSLYQLASATGREMANAGQQGVNLPDMAILDNVTYSCYNRTYTYDMAGNLTRIRHSAPATNHSYTTDITVSDRSNRAVDSTLTQDPAAVEALFNASGQQKALLPGQQLNWTPRGELHAVTQVMREGAADDGESYRYDIGNQRVLKVSTQKTATHMRTQRVQYLPGLELRSTTQGGSLTEQLQVVLVGEAGHAQVRALHWAAGKPPELANAQLRYSYADQLGSGCLEVDGSGAVISQEEYYPYGGTAVWAARSEVQGRYKFVRYSGKERDATGLYYYGYRYYQPWLGRWLSADPAGTVDGLNLYAMVRNNPMTLVDELGLRGKGNKNKGGGNSSGAQGTPVANASDGAGSEPVASTSASVGPSRDGAWASSSHSEGPAADSQDDDGWEVVAPKAKKEVERRYGLRGSSIYSELFPLIPAISKKRPENVLAIAERPSFIHGRREVSVLEEKIYQESGKTMVGGLDHVRARHAGHFAKDGVRGDREIQREVMNAWVNGKDVGIQNYNDNKRARLIYHVGGDGSRNPYVSVQLNIDRMSVLGANPLQNLDGTRRAPLKYEIDAWNKEKANTMADWEKDKSAEVKRRYV
jgi:insecticidal toxin complex protein TccC